MKKEKPSRIPSWLKGTWVRYVLFLGGAFIGVAGTLVIVFVFLSKPAPSVDRVPTGEVMTDEQLSASMEEEMVRSTSTGIIQDDYDVSISTDETVSVNLRVNWQEPRILSDEEARALYVAGTDQKEEAESSFDAMLDGTGFVTHKGTWEMGSVQGGPYNEAKIYLFKSTEPGLGEITTFVYFMKTVEGMTYGIREVPQYSYTKLFRFLTFLPNVGIPELEIPDILTMTNGRKLYITPYAGLQPFEYQHEHDDYEYSVVAKTRDGRNVYRRYTLDYSDCFIVLSADGREYRYASHITGKEGLSTSGIGELFPDKLTPAVQWREGYENANEYTFRETGGCGSYGCSHIVSDQEVNASGDLVVVGTTNEGDEIVAPKDPSKHPMVQELYDRWYDPSWNGHDSKPDMVEFLRRFSVPVFFWKDTFSRWNAYIVSAAVPLAECGKPVIYLYPESTTDVHVSLPPSINVTVSEPTYPVKGWNVTAEPNGQLQSHEDGNTYGSLYWEGTGVGYQTPETGFVVNDGNVEAFLAGILPMYGLNETETREFMEFWVPEMTGAPYYRVSFLTNDWSKAAPLNVSPRPDTSIRIFMDWAPLYAPIFIEPPQISTPSRDGFTLVEWGGTLYGEGE